MHSHTVQISYIFVCVLIVPTIPRVSLNEWYSSTRTRPRVRPTVHATRGVYVFSMKQTCDLYHHVPAAEFTYQLAGFDDKLHCDVSEYIRIFGFQFHHRDAHKCTIQLSLMWWLRIVFSGYTTWIGGMASETPCVRTWRCIDASRGSKTAAYSCNCETCLQDRVILPPVALSHRNCYGTLSLSRHYVAFLCVPLDLMPIAMMVLLFKKKLLYMHAWMVIIWCVRSLLFWVHYTRIIIKQYNTCLHLRSKQMSCQRFDVVLISFRINIDIACSNSFYNLEITRFICDLATSYTPSMPTKKRGTSSKASL
jgi:hypothetical protein